jgi:hypothetical protein
VERKGWVASKWEVAKDRRPRIQILPPDTGRQKATHCGRVEMEATDPRQCPNHVAR